MRPAPVGEPDDLEAVTELAVDGLEEGLFEASGPVSSMRITMRPGRTRSLVGNFILPNGKHQRVCE
jgi:hypothetical protein